MFWFRRDLRLDDNVGLYHAIKNETKVVSIFIFDIDILNRLPKEDSRVCFLHQQIEELNQQLAESNKKIHVYHGKPIDIFRKILSANAVHAVYTNRDYEPYSTKRDAEIKAFLSENDVTFSTFKDHVIFEQDEVVKSDGTPYRVYTPYSRVWLDKFNRQKHLKSYRIDDFEKLTILVDHNNPTLDEIGFTASKITAPQYDTSDEIIDQYEARRNTPAVAGTSKVGVHLRFGTLSIRNAVAKALESTNQTFLKELIWREFFMQILWHFPHTENKSFKPQYDRIEWRNDPEEFKRWCEGKTGFPFVDAGMR